MMKDKDMLDLMQKHEKILGAAYHGGHEKITVDLVLFMEMYEVVYSGILKRQYEELKRQRDLRNGNTENE